MGNTPIPLLSLSLFLAQFKSNTKYALGTCWRTPARNLGVVPDV